MNNTHDKSINIFSAFNISKASVKFKKSGSNFFIKLFLVLLISLTACSKNDDLIIHKTSNTKTIISSGMESVMGTIPMGLFTYDENYEVPCSTCPQDTLLLDTSNNNHYILVMLKPFQAINSTIMLPASAPTNALAKKIKVNLLSGNNPNTHYDKIYIGTGEPGNSNFKVEVYNVDGGPVRKGSILVGDSQVVNQ